MTRIPIAMGSTSLEAVNNAAQGWGPATSPLVGICGAWGPPRLDAGGWRRRP